MKNVIIGLILVFGFSTVKASEAIQGIKKDFTHFKEEMKAKLNETEKKIDELKSRAGNKTTEAQEKSIKDYEETRDQLKNQIEKISQKSESHWQKTKKRIAQSIDKLNKKVQKSLEQ